MCPRAGSHRLDCLLGRPTGVAADAGDSAFQHDIVRGMRMEFSDLRAIGDYVYSQRQAKHLIERGWSCSGAHAGVGAPGLQTH